MAILGKEFIAVPDDKKGQIVFKWPDVTIRKFTRAIVDADELAMFINTGKIVGTMGPGRYQIDAQELPFLGAIIDWATGGNAYRAELYFVGTREYTGNTFGGRIDDVQDPQTGMIVTLRVFGDYSLKVSDPAALITQLVGTVDVTNNQAITGWVSDQLLKVMRTNITTQIVRNGWPILGLSAYTQDIEQTVIEKGNEQLHTYGLTLMRMGNFDVNLSDQDEAQLKTLAKDTAYSRLAGSFGQYAAGEMQLGAGQGMAKGGAATGGAFLAAGLGLGGQAAAPYQYGPTPPPGPGFAGGGAGFVGGGPPPGGAGGGGAAAAPAEGADAVVCSHCHAANPAGAKFCGSCGQGLAPPAPATQVCGNCHASNPMGAKFCANCGQPLAPAVIHCSQCGEVVAPGVRFCANCGTAVSAAAGAGAASAPPPPPPPATPAATS